MFVLEVDRDTLDRRLDQRVGDAFGARVSERALARRLHRTGQGTPDGIAIDATAPLAEVVDEIVRRAAASPAPPTDAAPLRTARPPAATRPPSPRRR